jgi:hypothetical protein
MLSSLIAIEREGFCAAGDKSLWSGKVCEYCSSRFGGGSPVTFAAVSTQLLHLGARKGVSWVVRVEEPASGPWNKSLVLHWGPDVGSKLKGLSVRAYRLGRHENANHFVAYSAEQLCWTKVGWGGDEPHTTE